MNYMQQTFFQFPTVLLLKSYTKFENAIGWRKLEKLTNPHKLLRLKNKWDAASDEFSFKFVNLLKMVEWWSHSLKIDWIDVTYGIKGIQADVKDKARLAKIVPNRHILAERGLFLR